MSSQQGNYKLFAIAAGAILILAGCGPQAQKPMKFCPGSKSLEESLSALSLQSQNIRSLRAGGKGRLKYYADGKSHSESFTIRLFMNPPAEIYLQCDKAFMPKAIILGSNEREFWLLITPKEVSSYQWGRWSDSAGAGNLVIGPKTVLEALGIIMAGNKEEVWTENWSLSNEGFFDVLVKHGDNGAITQKVYIYSCDYRISKIEYFDEYGRLAVVTELGKYKQVCEGFSVPTDIKIVNCAEKDEQDLGSVSLELRSVRTKRFSDELRKNIFSRPKPKGFKNVGKI